MDYLRFVKDKVRPRLLESYLVLKYVTIGVSLGGSITRWFGTIKFVDGDSMQPTLNPRVNDQRGSYDWVLINSWSYRNFDVKPGDIVALRSIRNPNKRVIKRVIALEGDCIYSLSKNSPDQVVNIPKGHCWIEGDNSKTSWDSNRYGPVPVGMIIGRADFIVWPPRRWSRLESKLTVDHAKRRVVAVNS